MKIRENRTVVHALSSTCPVCNAYNNIEANYFGIFIGKEIFCIKCNSKLSVIEKPKSIFFKLFSIACGLFVYTLLRPIMIRYGLGFLLYVLTLISICLVVVIIEFNFQRKYIIIPNTDKKTLHRIQFVNIFFLSLIILSIILMAVFLN